MPMNAKAEQKERSHESILQSAARLVRGKGISGAGVAEVMKGAALTVGGFYAHFSSKDELVEETLRRTGAALRERLFARLDEKPEADRAGVVLNRYLSADHRDGGTPGCPMPAVVGEVGTTAPQHRTMISKEVQALVEGLAQPRGRSSPTKCFALAARWARLPPGAAREIGHERRGGGLDGSPGAASRDAAETDSSSHRRPERGGGPGFRHLVPASPRP